MVLGRYISISLDCAGEVSFGCPYIRRSEIVDASSRQIPARAINAEAFPSSILIKPESASMPKSKYPRHGQIESAARRLLASRYNEIAMKVKDDRVKVKSRFGYNNINIATAISKTPSKSVRLRATKPKTGSESVKIGLWSEPPASFAMPVNVKTPMASA